MTTAMGPPPPRASNLESDPSAEPEAPKTLQEEGGEAAAAASTSSSATVTPMAPPPPRNPISPAENDVDASNPDDGSVSESDATPNAAKRGGVAVPYTIPPWSEPPRHQFFLEVLKDGAIIDQLNVHEKGAYMFGRVDLCDFVLEHPTVSRFHAVLQFNGEGDSYIFDIGSTHGTFVNKNQVKKNVYVDLHVGDVIRFGQSSRLYIFQGPSDLMPPEAEVKVIRDAKMREEMQDREASLRRAREDACLADGISWGMGEDAVEEEEDDTEEVTWQTYKGELTEKQEKTREKVLKRTQKIAHMKKEIDAIRAKDIAQGGLTQGQQTQIARNEQRITQILEELESLEETLNDSIRESLGARTGKLSLGRNKRTTEDEEEYLSDDDEFYDRSKKKANVPKIGQSPAVETADTLLDKRDAIRKQIEEKKELLLNEKKKIESDSAAETDAGDALDAYMSGLSSQLILDKTTHLENEISSLQSELDRIVYLLKFADPSGEASKRRDLKVEEPKSIASDNLFAPIEKHISSETKERNKQGKSANGSRSEGTIQNTKSSKKPDDVQTLEDKAEEKAVPYTVVKPQWLGAIDDMQERETHKEPEISDVPDSDQFVGYKDRSKILAGIDSHARSTSGIEGACGLIIRKRKPEGSEEKPNDHSSSSARGSELAAEDAVALLLKHQKGHYSLDSEGNEDMSSRQPSSNDVKKPKRVLGPEKPSFLNASSDYESWVPPEGQSGDGRTTLNDRYGY
ncbi:kanadaptin [Rhodamnia argentea]|uniref:Kanadaptin n=1 Tax=Rhodamnia argentea TaxID=178133 RepID=A0A8B8QLB8_9MYRT|nr:kanadaptin [Rhodamnia argentea]